MTQSKDPQAALAQLEGKLGHTFADPALLSLALTHASSRSDRLRSNERLEFLGDRILGLSVANMLYERFPEEIEGELGYRFTALVRRDALAIVAAQIGMADYVKLSSGEIGAGGRENPSILADCCEAVIGAIFLDAGYAAADNFVRRFWTDQLDQQSGPVKDAKTRLQERCQQQGKQLPVYDVISRTGPDHMPTFVVQVTIDGRPPTIGDGKSKQEAEQAAADESLIAWDDELESGRPGQGDTA